MFEVEAVAIGEQNGPMSGVIVAAITINTTAQFKSGNSSARRGSLGYM